MRGYFLGGESKMLYMMQYTPQRTAITTPIITKATLRTARKYPRRALPIYNPPTTTAVSIMERTTLIVSMFGLIRRDWHP